MEGLVKIGTSIAIACGFCFGGIVNAVDDIQYRNAMENGSLYVLVDENGEPVGQK